MPILANPRQEAFCQARAAGKSQEEAYRIAGYKPSRPHAQRLATNGNVVKRLAELAKPVAERFEITIEGVAAQLIEDHRFAKECKVPSAMVAATVALGKLGGLMVERATVQVTHNYAMMSEEELRFELAAINAEARAIKPGMNH